MKNKHLLLQSRACCLWQIRIHLFSGFFWLLCLVVTPFSSRLDQDWIFWPGAGFLCRTFPFAWVALMIILPRACTASGEWKWRLRLAWWNLVGVFFLLKEGRKYSRIVLGASRECPECLLILGCGSINGFCGQRALAEGWTFPIGILISVWLCFWSCQINSQILFLIPCAAQILTHLSWGWESSVKLGMSSQGDFGNPVSLKLLLKSSSQLSDRWFLNPALHFPRSWGVQSWF